MAGEAIWAGVWSLSGVIVGAWLAWHGQRKQWILDSKAAEYRQVLDLLNAYRWKLLNHLAAHAPLITAQDPKTEYEEGRVLSEAAVSVSNALRDRLFIRDRLARTRVREDFENLLKGVYSTKEQPSVSEATQILSDLHDRVLQAANDDLGLKGHA